jgi:hypothetical protein
LIGQSEIVRRGGRPRQAAIRTGSIGQSDDIPEKTESYYAEVDPAVEYADGKTKLGTSPGVDSGAP